MDVGKPLGPGGCRMQSRGAGWCHFGAVQGWLAASQEAEIYFFFSQLVSYGGGEVGWEEAEQIAILGMRKARELGRGRRRERGSPTDRNFCSKAPKPIKPQQTDTPKPYKTHPQLMDTEKQEREEAWLYSHRDIQSHPQGRCTNSLCTPSTPLPVALGVLPLS